MVFKKTRTAPSPYPRILFHGIRVAQAVSSIIVASIMFYFIRNLHREGYNVPKTFFVLVASSLLTFFGLIGTLVVYAFFGLSPRINLIVNGFLLLLWVPGFALLSYYSGATLSHVCNRANWNGPVGISVCRTYKAVFAFAILGLLSTLAGLVLDVVTWKRTVSRGKYAQANASSEKPLGISAPAEPYAAQGYTDSRSSIALEQYTTPNSQKDATSGYTIPAEQFSYGQADTAYHGGHHPEPTSTLAATK